MGEHEALLANVAIDAAELSTLGPLVAPEETEPGAASKARACDRDACMADACACMHADCAPYQIFCDPTGRLSA